MTIPKLAKFIVLFIVNFGLLYLYAVGLHQHLRIVETLIIVLFGSFICFSFFSFLKNPKQFFQALKEWIIRPFAVLLIIFLKLFGITFSLFTRTLKLIIALIVIIGYGAWPLDLIPDIIFGLGWLDDIAVTLLVLYWALTFGKIAFSANLNSLAKHLNEITKVKTKFP